MLSNTERLETLRTDRTLSQIYFDSVLTIHTKTKTNYTPRHVLAETHNQQHTNEKNQTTTHFSHVSPEDLLQCNTNTAVE